MKLLTLTIVSWFFAAFSYQAIAQEDKDKKESQEIIIRKNNDKDAKILIEINGDIIKINGKPLMEFNDDGITINKKKIIVRDGNHFGLGGNMDFDMDNFSWDKEGKTRTFLGVSTETTNDGVRITDVTNSSPAEKAGLIKYDIITKPDDTKITSPEQLYEVVTKMKKGDEVKVHFKRGNKDTSVKAVLAEKKESSAMSFSMTGPDGKNKVITIPPTPSMPRMQELEQLKDLEGMDFSDGGYSFQSPRQKKLGLKIQDTEEANGVKVIEVEENSAAEKAGIKENDVITEIAGKKITNTDEARGSLQENKDKPTYSLKAKRNGTEMSFDIKIPKKLKTTNL